MTETNQNNEEETTEESGMWDYRVVREHRPDGEEWFEIREVYFDSRDGVWATCFATAGGEGIDSIQYDLTAFLEALDKPVIDERDIDGAQHRRDLEGEESIPFEDVRKELGLPDRADGDEDSDDEDAREYSKEDDQDPPRGPANTWDYRVVWEHTSRGKRCFEIREVQFDSAGGPWTTCDALPAGRSLYELRNDIETMRLALEEPFIAKDDISARQHRKDRDDEEEFALGELATKRLEEEGHLARDIDEVFLETYGKTLDEMADEHDEDEAADEDPQGEDTTSRG